MNARLLVFVTLGLIPIPGAAQSLAPDSVVYDLAPPPASRLMVRTGKAGLLGFAGHEHLIQAREFSGAIVYYPGQAGASHLTVSIATEHLEVLTPPDTAEIRKVTAAMRVDVLDVAQYPEITLISQSVEEAGDTLRVQAALTMKGQTRTVPLTVRVRMGPDTLRATTTFTVRQSDYGIRPYRGGPAGTVRVADAVTFDIDAIALRRP
jgi:polyisoprenoid-binding protein YceI